jgi:hypothetical protein
MGRPAWLRYGWPAPSRRVCCPNEVGKSASARRQSRASAGRTLRRSLLGAHQRRAPYGLAQLAPLCGEHGEPFAQGGFDVIVEVCAAIAAKAQDLAGGADRHDHFAGFLGSLPITHLGRITVRPYASQRSGRPGPTARRPNKQKESPAGAGLSSSRGWRRWGDARAKPLLCQRPAVHRPSFVLSDGQPRAGPWPSSGL